MKELLEKLLQYLVEQDGGGVLLFHRNSDGHPSWLVSFEFGKEAEDSDMVGGAAYGADDDLEAAVRDVARQCGLAS